MNMKNKLIENKVFKNPSGIFSNFPLGNKKGQFFSILLVVAVIGLLTYAYSEFNKKHKGFDYELGERQYNLLKDYYKAEESMLYIDLSTKYAIQQALYDTGKKGGYLEIPDCGSYEGFVLWSYLKRGCFPNMSVVRTSIGGLAKEYLSNYLGGNDFWHKWGSFPLKDLVDIQTLEESEDGYIVVDDLNVIIRWTKEGDMVTLEDNENKRKYMIDIKQEKWVVSSLISSSAGVIDGYSYDFVFEDKEEDVKSVSFDYFPLDIKLDELQADNFKENDGNKIIEWFVTDNIATVYDLFDPDNIKEYKVNIKNGRWDGKDIRLNVKGIAAVPLVYDSSCVRGKCSTYVVRPNTLTKFDYRLSLYDEVIKGAREINKTCAEKERDEKKDLKGCVEEEVARRGWYLGYCPSFSEKEEECIAKGKVAYINDGKLRCDDCPNVYASCDRYINKVYCERDPCNLGCEWSLTTCIPKISVGERGCMEVKGQVPYFSRGFFGSVVYDIFGVELNNPDLTRCAKCPDDAECENYINEEYCNLDPCEIGCYGQVDDEGKYVQCAKCPGLFECEHVYSTEEYCELDPCTNGRCNWVRGQCIGPSKPDKKDIDEDRTFKMCVTDGRFFVYDDELEQTKELDVGIRFAINIPDITPPKAIKRLEVKDKDIAEDSIILRWDKSLDKDISHYYVYYVEFNGANEEDKKQEFISNIKKGTKRIRIEGRDNSEWVVLNEIDLNNPKEDKKASYNTNNGYIELDTNVVYDVDEDFVYVLDAKLRQEEDNKEEPGKYAYDNLIDGKSYFVAITPVDIYDNENREIKVVVVDENKGEEDDWPKDDLAPDQVNLEQKNLDYVVKEQMVILKYWERIDKNTDGSKNNDLKGYRVYYEDSDFDSIDGLSFKMDVVDNYAEVDVFGVTTDMSNKGIDEKEYYFAVVGYDEDENMYNKVKTVNIKLTKSDINEAGNLVILR